MEAALCFSPFYYCPSLITTKISSTKCIVPSSKMSTNPISGRALSTRLMATPVETSTVDYASSPTSVFPAEACETIGGDACDAQIFPETKLPQDNSIKAKSAEEVDREYVEYDEPKTVFPAEACDDLGGEFCQPEYQKGVY
ncbi:hypothetical protein ACHQM5_010374 [Ranunculus cassubicifolius]